MDIFIKDLLNNKTRVIIPNFGSFIKRPGEENEIVFNEFLKFDDGVLLEYLVEKKKIEKDAAKKEISNYVDEIQKAFQQGKEFKVGDLGSLKKNESGKIEFVSKGGGKVSSSSSAPTSTSNPSASTQSSPAKTTSPPPPATPPPPAKEQPKPQESVKPSASSSSASGTTGGGKTEPVFKTTRYKDAIKDFQEEEKKKSASTTSDNPVKSATGSTTTGSTAASTTASSSSKTSSPGAKSSTKPSAAKPSFQANRKKEKSSPGGGGKIVLFFLAALLIGGIVVAYFYKETLLPKYFGPKEVISENTDEKDEENLETATLDGGESDSAQVINTGMDSSTEEGIEEEMEEETYEPPVEEPVYSGKMYYVVAGCFREQWRAEKYKQFLHEKGFNEAIVFGKVGNLHAVSYEAFSSKQAAMNQLMKIRGDYQMKGWIKYY